MKAVNKGTLTQKEIMDQYGVSETFIYTLCKRVKETGSIEPKRHGGGMPSKFKGKEMEILRNYVESYPDGYTPGDFRLYWKRCQHYGSVPCS